MHYALLQKIVIFLQELNYERVDLLLNACRELLLCCMMMHATVSFG